MLIAITAEESIYKLFLKLFLVSNYNSFGHYLVLLRDVLKIPNLGLNNGNEVCALSGVAYYGFVILDIDGLGHPLCLSVVRPNNKCVSICCLGSK